MANEERVEFGPDDPRTPSLGSVPGVPLSFENLRKLIEQYERDLDFGRFMQHGKKTSEGETAEEGSKEN